MNRYLRDESGAVAVIVALFIASIAIILAAIVIDLGGLWSSQRALVTDTDAAALAGAVELAENWIETGDCDEGLAENEASRILDLNNPDDEIIGTSAECRIEGDAFIGQVQMTAQQPSPGYVSGEDLRAGGTTTATFQLELGEGEGFAICTNVFEGDTGGGAKSQFEVGDYVAIPYFRQNLTMDALADSCSSVWPAAPTIPGGWGWLRGTCEYPESGGWCPSDTGNNNIQSWGSSDIGRTFEFPIFSESRGNGSNGEFFIVGFARGELAGTCRTGGPAPFDPADCSTTPNSSFNGNPQFVLLQNVVTEYFGNKRPQTFSRARYSICDVDGTDRFCP